VPDAEAKIDSQARAASATPLLPDVAAELGALWLDILRQIHEASNTLFKHGDAMLTWAIGLMGAGVFYANTLLAKAPRGLRFLALAPWIVGILASLAGRMIGSRILQKNGIWYMKEVLAFKGAVVASKDLLVTVEALVESVARIIAEARAQQSRLYWWWLRLSLAAHILAGTGVLTVVVVSFLANTAATVVIGVVIFPGVIVFVRAFGAVKKAFERSLEETMIAARRSLKPTGREGSA
jgi:hypothetical protein